MDETYEDEQRAAKGPWKVIKTIFKILFIGLILFIYLFFMLRYCTGKPKQRMLWNDATKAAYSEAGNGFKVYTQSPQVFIDDNSYMVANKENESLQIAIYNILYIPDAKQLQVTVRYNKNVFEKLKNSYNLTKDIEGEPFVYSLLFEDGTRITDYQYSGYSTSRYYFRYLVFDNVELDSYKAVMYTPQDAAITDSDGNIIAHETDEDGYSILYETDENGAAIVYNNTYVCLDIYYIKDVDYNKTPNSSLIVFNRDLKLEEFKYKKYLPSDDELPIMNPPIYEDHTDD